MDDKTSVLIALGAAVAANCIPCFDHLHERAREVQLTDEEMKEALELATRVKNGAQITLKNHVNEVLGGAQESTEPCCAAGAGSCS